MFVNVIVNVPSSLVDKVFEYHVPEYLEDFISVGSRIKISFGEANRLIHGFIIDIHDEKQFDGPIKDIEDVPDLKPVINLEQFKLAYYLKDTTFSPLVRILNCMIPNALKMKTSKYLTIKNFSELDAEIVDLFHGQEIIKYTPYVAKYVNKIKKALKDDLIEISYEAKDQAKEAYQDVYYLTENYLEENLKRVKKQATRDIVSLLKPKYPYDKNDLQNLGLTDYGISSLVKYHIIYKKKVLKSRILERNYDINDDYYKSYASNEANKFFEQVVKTDKEVLWLPVDDNEIIQGISLVASKNIENDLNTVIVVPDILSSFKLSDLIKKYLGIPVLCINSNINDGESLDGYKSICNNEYKVIVTTPVGVLWPFQNVGTFFVIDEESDNYYNDQSPRYDVKEVIRYRSLLHNAKCIFASFTPNLDLYSYGLQNKIKLIDNSQNIGYKKTADNINYDVVNMTAELKNGNISPISESLRVKIINAIKNKKATLLILNNKGYSDFVLCRSCGHVEKCEKCNISLKYQEKNNRLYCPACGKFKEFTKKCSACSSSSIKMMGLGAEKLKEVVEQTIEGASVTIIDEPKYSRFKEQVRMVNDLETNVIIATDTYSRGLVNTNISVVGVMSIDLMLKSPGYKANQKTFSMLQHAKHILKRNQYNSEMVIQTYEPEHFIIQSLVTDNYLSYFKQELSYRNLLQAPPFYEVNRIIVKGKYENLFKTAYDISKFIKSNVRESIIIGPVYNYTESGVQLIIKHPHLDLNELYTKIYDKYQDSNLFVIIDAYPRSIL